MFANLSLRQEMLIPLPEQQKAAATFNNGVVFDVNFQALHLFSLS